MFIADALVACVVAEQYPWMVIEVVVLWVIALDGLLIYTALNAATLALLDAGVEMKLLPVGTTCSVKTNGSTNVNVDALVVAVRMIHFCWYT